MSSDAKVPRFMRDPEQPMDQVGRTWADILYSARRWILGGLVLCIAGVAIYLGGGSLSGVSTFLEKYSDAIGFFIGCFVLFFIIGRGITRRLLRVPMMDYLVLDFDSMTGAIYRIPAPLLARMDVEGGNNLTFSWRTGDSFRLARSVDLENGVIRTAWPHEVPIEQAAFTLSDLQRREEDYEKTKIENLYLRRRPVVIAADLAKKANVDLTHEISDALSLDELDAEAYLEGLDPLKSRMSGTETGAGEGGDSDAGEQAAE